MLSTNSPFPSCRGSRYLRGGKADIPQLQDGRQDSPGGGQLIIREADTLQSLHQDQKVLTVLLPQDVTSSALRIGTDNGAQPLLPRAGAELPAAIFREVVQCFKDCKNLK